MARRLTHVMGVLTPSPSKLELQRQREDIKAKNVVGYLEALNVSRDKLYQRRVNLLAINTVLAIVLMIITLEIEWHPKHGRLEEKEVAAMLKFFIIGLSILYVAQLLDYYSMVLRIEKEHTGMLSSLKGPKGKHTLLSEERPRSKANQVSLLTVLKTSDIPLKLLMEIAVTIPQPIPYVDCVLDKPFGLLMFLRLYIVVRWYKFHSTIYKKRKMIERIPGYSHITHPTFNSMLSTKMFFFKYPILFVLIALSAFSFILGYSLYVFEREGPWLDPSYYDQYKPLDSFWVCFYIIINATLMAWGSDTYDVYNPYTSAGKFFCIIGVVLGVFLFALLVDYVHTTMQPTPFQATALQWVMISDVQEQERQVAARLIQLAWRRYKWRKSLHPNTPKSVKKEEKAKFVVEYTNQVKAFRSIRKERRKYTNAFRETQDKVASRTKQLEEDKTKQDLSQIQQELKQIRRMIRDLRNELVPKRPTISYDELIDLESDFP